MGSHLHRAVARAVVTTGARPRAVARVRQGDHVVVVGAGPAGLTAACELARQGIRTTVLEAGDVVGGISQTACYKGYRFDIGGHRFFTKIAPVQAFWEEMLGEELISVPRLSRIHYRGRYFDYPLKAANALGGLGLWNSLRIVASFVWAQVHPHRVEENLEQWVSNRFGRRLYEIFFKTYTEKVWGISCTEIRAEWAAQRISGLSLAKAILNSAPLMRRDRTIRTLTHEFRYPRLGPGQMWEAARDRAVECGAEVQMRSAVTGVEVEGGRAVAVSVCGPDGARRIEADHVISTMPLAGLVRALGPAASARALAAADGLRYRDFLVVALVLDQEHLFPDNWIYIHTPGVRVGRIQNFNNWSAAMVPEPGYTCLGMEYFCFEGDDLWSSTDEDLVALATRELGTLALADPKRVVDGTVVRMPKAYPIYDSAYRAHLDGVRVCIDPIPNLHTIGRNGMHKYNNQDHSMLTAMLTVANMRGAAHDVWAVNTDFEYHEEQRVDAPADPLATASGGRAWPRAVPADAVPFLSVVVPAHDAAAVLRRCLSALADSDLPRDQWELIVVDDASTDETASIAAEYADTVVRLPRRAYGPAYARNRGGELARGEGVVFVDADVCVHRDALSRFARVFSCEADVSAVFGSYDDRPAADGVVSQYRNLLHHYVHQRGEGETDTFWAGCGAVRRSVFVEAGMYDEWRFPRPQIEDIDLGYRIRALGNNIVLRPEIQGTHLKRWTLRSMVTTDLQARGVPWMRLLLERGTVRQAHTLNLGKGEKVNAALVALLPLLVVAFSATGSVGWLAAAGLCLAWVAVSNGSLLRFFAHQRGIAFVLAAFPLHLVYYGVSVTSAVVGWLMHVSVGGPRPDPATLAFAETGVCTWPPIPMDRRGVGRRSQGSRRNR